MTKEKEDWFWYVWRKEPVRKGKAQPTEKHTKAKEKRSVDRVF